MRPLRTRIIFELALGVVIVASLLVIMRQLRRIAEYQRRQEADAGELRLLREALHQKGLEKAPTAVTGELPSAGDRAAIADREATIAKLDRELAESHATISDLQTQLAAGTDQIASTQAKAQEDLQKQQADAQAQLAELQKKLDAALTESDIARQRAAALEADNGKLRAAASAIASATDQAHIISSLQDLDRRREIYLTSILRRYRDITADFNAMSSVLDTSHAPGSGACSGTALTRIQNAVSSAEDDLRQISDLNARSQKLEKQLPKK